MKVFAKKEFSEPVIRFIEYRGDISLYKSNPVEDDGGVWTNDIWL